MLFKWCECECVCVLLVIEVFVPSYFFVLYCAFVFHIFLLRLHFIVVYVW